jgi:phosphinothricin acetyltransferase
MKTLRLAKIDDAPAIVEIYRAYVIDSAVSFEAQPPSIAEMQSRITEVAKKYPWLVYEEQGRILGYAYATTFRAREAYTWTAESTVYVDRQCHGQGIGKRLYTHLFGALKDQGICNVIAGITLPNDSSVRIHESFGFRAVARLTNAGFKLGRWWDVGYWQLEIAKPSSPKPLGAPEFRSLSVE